MGYGYIPGNKGVTARGLVQRGKPRRLAGAFFDSASILADGAKLTGQL
jgi:hypothetical protein